MANRISTFEWVWGEPKTGSTIDDEMYAEITIFLNSPAAMSHAARPKSMWRGIALVADLREQLLASHDRAGHQVREERQVDGQVDRSRGRELLR